MMKYKVLSILLFILLLYFSLVPRVVEVLNKNYLFGFDQGRDYLAVKSIIADRKITLIGSEIGAGSAGFQGIFHGPFYYYFLSIPFLIFNGDPYGGILLMFSFGLGAIALGYFLGKKLFGLKVGLVTALFIAISPPLVSQSRFVWNSHPSTFFILLCFYFIYKFIKNNKNRHLFLASFFAAFIYNFELAIAIPMVFAVVVNALLLRLRPKQFLLIFIAFFLVFLPTLLFELRHNFIGLNGFIAYQLHNKNTPMTLMFFKLISRDHLVSFWSSLLSTFPKQNLFPPILIGLIVLFPAFFYFLKEKASPLKKFIAYLLMLIPVNFAVFIFLRNAVYIYYLIDLNIAYIFLLSYSIYTAYKNRNFFLQLLLVPFLILLIFTSIVSYTFIAKYDYKDYGGTAKIKGRIDAIDYIYKDANGKKFGLLVFSPPIYTYPYDYLLWWYGENKYKYLPHKEKKGLFYLLIEKDLSKPWSYKGWLETVVKTGNVIYTKTLPSGFIIQKRSV